MLANATRTESLAARIPWIDGFAGALQKVFAPLLGQDAPRGPRDLLYGTWLGHPLHPAVVTVPLGCWTTAAALDLLGEPGGADLALRIGVASTPLAVASGMAQWQDATYDTAPRRAGALHAALNVGATLLMAGSMVARRRGDRPAGVALSTAGLGVAVASAWLGGGLAYDLGLGVDRSAFETPPGKWTDACDEAALEPGKPLRVNLPNAPVLLLRHADGIHAVGATCPHLGGPLDEGKIEGETVVCPWHGSVFSLCDGAVIHGPATTGATSYETRVHEGKVQVRHRATA